MIKTSPPSATTAAVVAELRRRPAFVMVSHVKPDGDTLGAGIALGLALQAMGKRVHYFQQDPVPRTLRFLPGADQVTRAVPSDLPAQTLWVFCDMSDSSRAGDFLPTIARENMLNIDHHLGNSRFAGLNYILETECSTGACVLRLLEAMNTSIDAPIATCLLTTIMTDTGAFMHSNAVANVLRMSADMMDRGADKELIINEIFANKRFATIRLVGSAMASSRLEDGGRYCWSVVDEAMLASCEADGEDTEEIVQHLRTIEDVEVAALFKDYDGEIRVSLRSNGKVNVQEAAALLGGGGHFRAAGLSHAGPLPATIVAVHDALVRVGL
ncbi:MAG TPA: bifunctional oligoribonuclease/PAP phosphatase NrnA [Candidatus Baltobacteraceae bacterium]|jgi:phosphoesterase RecJ-like protein|nr:bifunctional oligoribonuclease/PAP phosphatase NrnA [Candidatus Baltobacteraceae bacterium]